jgi:membrane associated rhomboid family serine protease
MRWGAPPPPRRGGGGGGGGYNVLGLFVAKPVAWVIAGTILITAVGALLQRNGIAPVLDLLSLKPGQVWAGELWRLPTWILLELNPLNLIFGSLLLYALGGDLVQRWGARRFLAFYFGVAATAAVLACLVGRIWADVLQSEYAGMWTAMDALIIAWAVLFPDRQILAMFVLPIGGRHLVTFTVAMTVVFGFMFGFAQFVPNFLAEMVALVYMDVFSLRRVYLRARMAMLQRDYQRRTSNMRMVDRDSPRDPDEPPRWTH